MAETAAPKAAQTQAQSAQKGGTDPNASSGEAAGFRDISGDEATEFLAQANRRGDYDDAVAAFAKSDAKLRVFSLSEGQFAGRKQRAMRAGLNTAIKNAGQKDKIKVVVRKDEVGLSR